MTDIRNMNWSQKEKKITRTAFNKAYDSEMKYIDIALRKRVSEIREAQDIWETHDFLTEQRNQIDRKYDYRYSVLIGVIGRLIREGLIRKEDLAGLSEDKMEAIEGIASF